MATYVLCPLSTFLQAMAGATNPATGTPLSGGLIWTYAAGTTTPTATWTDSTGATPNSNPIQLNTYGQLNNVNIYQLAGSKIKVLISTNAGTVGSPVFGTQVGPTFDNLVGVGDTVSGQTTYYGGTDTGSANAYILTFAATFSSYVNGTIIYWIPSNSNTTASTLNVNGLGALSIVYPDGSALVSGQITANQIVVVAVSAGKFVYLGASPISTAGTQLFLGSGFSGTTNFTATYSVVGNAVILYIPQTSGTSNSTSFSMQSAPNFSIVPTNAQFIPIAAVQDNGSASYAQTAVVSGVGLGRVNIAIYKGGSATGWTNSGTKGLGDGITGAAIVLSYVKT